MDNQHRKISGYRDLSQDEIDLMNKIEEKSKEVGVLVQELMLHNTSKLDTRWIAIGQTDLQKGFMALVRAVAQPQTF